MHQANEQSYMKKIMRIILVFSIFLVLASCSRPTDDKQVIPVRQHIGNQPSTKLSDYAEDIYYIPLETPEDLHLRGNERVAVTSEHIIIFGGQCYLFSKNGDFIRRIGSRGRGPGEYSTASTGYFFPYNSNIYFPASRIKTVAYSLNNEYLEEINLPHNFVVHRNISDHLLAGYRMFHDGNADWNIFVFDNNGDSVWVKENKFRFSGVSEITFYNEISFYYYDDKLHMKELYSDTIYKFSHNGELSSKYSLDLGDYSFPPELKEDFEQFLSASSRKYFNVTNIYESARYLIFEYRFNRMNNIMICDKITGDIENFPLGDNNDGIVNDFDGGLPFLPEYNSNNLFVQLFNPFEIKDHVAGEDFKNNSPKFPEKKKEFEKLANSLDEYDNPVLMLVRMKE